MTSIWSRYLKHISVMIVILAALYKYEVPTKSADTKTLLVTKKSTLPYNKSHVYQIITSIDKFAGWYPNVARVERIKPTSSRTTKLDNERYRLFTKIPLIGEITSELTIQTAARPNRFIYSVNSWLMEVNSIELKDNPKDVNSTDVEWTAYTKRRSVLFQYLLLPFAKFYKNQIVREALFSLMLQIRNL